MNKKIIYTILLFILSLIVTVGYYMAVTKVVSGEWTYPPFTPSILAPLVSLTLSLGGSIMLWLWVSGPPRRLLTTGFMFQTLSLAIMLFVAIAAYPYGGMKISILVVSTAFGLLAAVFLAAGFVSCSSNKKDV